MFSFKPFPSNWKTFYWETPPHRHTHTRTHLAVDEGDAVSVAGQLSNRLRSVLPQRPSVPHLAQCVIAAREQQLGRAVGERHRVHVVLVGINLMRMAAKERVSVYCMARVHMCARMCYLQVGYLHVVVKSVCVCALMHVCAYAEVMKGAFFFKAAAHWNSDFSVHEPQRLCYKQALYTRHGCESPNAKM